MKQPEPNLLERSRRAAARLWLGIREWCGDAAYERYVKSQRRRAGAAPVLTAEEFYVEQLQKRYSRMSRCC
jgi:uncharacterized short protein YbdD (DUF466 family)